jgi:hypothetical protein
MSNSLTPCPFCDNLPQFVYDGWQDERRYVQMRLTCCAEMTASIGWNKARDMTEKDIKTELTEHLAKQWNTRENSDRIAELEREVAELKQQLVDTSERGTKDYNKLLDIFVEVKAENTRLRNTVAASTDKTTMTVQPVAVIGETWTLLWCGTESIAKIVDRHGLKIGDNLYAASQPQASQDKDNRDAERGRLLMKQSWFSEKDMSFHFAPIKYKWHAGASSEVAIAIDSALAQAKEET